MEKNFPDFRPGDIVKVFLRIPEAEKERTQVFEGMVIGRKHGGISQTFTVRKSSYGVGVEYILPLYSPFIKKIEPVKRTKVRRAKLYYLRKEKR